eukprot:gene15567-biopygen1138
MGPGRRRVMQITVEGSEGGCRPGKWLKTTWQSDGARGRHGRAAKNAEAMLKWLRVQKAAQDTESSGRCRQRAPTADGAECKEGSSRCPKCREDRERRCSL